jgi:predicted GNAT family acetyltransferase
VADSRVVRNEAESRYEVSVDGSLAQLVYREVGDRLALVHTEVPDELGGQGLGGELARYALDDAMTRNLTVVPYCPFVQSWLKKHPEIAERQPITWP